MIKLKQINGWVAYTLAAAAVPGAVSWYFHEKACEVHRHVFLYQKDKATEALTARKTVGEILREQGIALKPQDVVVPSLSAAVTEGMEIELGLVERRVKDEKKKVSFVTHTDYTDALNVGEIIDVEQGKDGLEERETEAFYLNGEEAFE